MQEIRGELINVIKKPKRLLDAVRKPCWRKVDAYSQTEGGISGYSNKPKSTPIQLPLFHKNVLSVDYSKIELFIKKSHHRS